MELIEADRARLRSRAKIGWWLIGGGFGIVALVFAIVHGVGVDEGSRLFTILLVAGYAGGVVALIGGALIMIFHLYDRSYPRQAGSKIG